jgi:hypothetical protein
VPRHPRRASQPAAPKTPAGSTPPGPLQADAKQPLIDHFITQQKHLAQQERQKNECEEGRNRLNELWARLSPDEIKRALSGWQAVDIPTVADVVKWLGSIHCQLQQGSLLQCLAEPPPGLHPQDLECWQVARTIFDVAAEDRSRAARLLREMHGLPHGPRVVEWLCIGFKNMALERPAKPPRTASKSKSEEMQRPTEQPVQPEGQQTAGRMGDQGAAKIEEARTPSKRPTEFTTAWPLGMYANLAERKVWRNGAEADLAANKRMWGVLSKLTQAHPNAIQTSDLLELVWGDPSDSLPELGAVYTTVSSLCVRLAPLGVCIANKRGRGYILAERT